MISSTTFNTIRWQSLETLSNNCIRNTFITTRSHLCCCVPITANDLSLPCCCVSIAADGLSLQWRMTFTDTQSWLCVAYSSAPVVDNCILIDNLQHETFLSHEQPCIKCHFQPVWRSKQASWASGGLKNCTTAGLTTDRWILCHSPFHTERLLQVTSER